eukprot:751244-Hanusia_phi.AAC.2
MGESSRRKRGRGEGKWVGERRRERATDQVQETENGTEGVGRRDEKRRETGTKEMLAFALSFCVKLHQLSRGSSLHRNFHLRSHRGDLICVSSCHCKSKVLEQGSNGSRTREKKGRRWREERGGARRSEDGRGGGKSRTTFSLSISFSCS